MKLVKDTVINAKVDGSETLTTATYSKEEVEGAMRIILEALETDQTPMPLAVIALDNILDMVRARGVVFEREPVFKEH